MFGRTIRRFLLLARKNGVLLDFARFPKEEIAMPDEPMPDPRLVNGLTTEERACIPEALVETKMLSFRGRIGRAVFWGRLLVAVFCAVIGVAGTSIVLFLVPGLPGNESTETPVLLTILLSFIGIVAIVLGLGSAVIGIWISLATHVKRWHDLNLTGWMLLLNLIPYVGLLTLIWEGCFRGTDGPNRFGPNPI